MGKFENVFRMGDLAAGNVSFPEKIGVEMLDYKKIIEDVRKELKNFNSNARTLAVSPIPGKTEEAVEEILKELKSLADFKSEVRAVASSPDPVESGAKEAIEGVKVELRLLKEETRELASGVATVKAEVGSGGDKETYEAVLKELKDFKIFNSEAEARKVVSEPLVLSSWIVAKWSGFKELVAKANNHKIYVTRTAAEKAAAKGVK